MRATNCLESLNSKDMNLRQEQISSPFRYEYMDDQSSTGQRITTQDWMWDDTAKGPGLVKWLGSGKGIFWISGKPGSGKSTVMKNLWENDRSQELLPLYSDSITVSPSWLRICAFFYDRGTSMQRSLLGVLMKLIYQIIDAHRELVDLVSPHGLLNYEKPISRQTSPIPAIRNFSGDLRRGTEPGVVYDWSLANLKAAFQCITRQTTSHLNILALIDGLDEHEHEEEERSDQHSDMMAFFHELVSSTSPNVRLKIVVSSRPENAFRDRLDSSDGFSVEKYTRLDIEKYIQGRLGLKLGVSPAGGFPIPRRSAPTYPRIPNLGHSSGDSKGSEHHDSKELMMEIARRAQGVFLWVKLVVDQLLKEWEKNRFISMLRAKLDELPHGLQELYEHILKRIAKRDPKASFITIELVLRSQRPLSLLELSIMVAFIDNRGKHNMGRQFSTEVITRIKQGEESRKNLFKNLHRMLQDRCMGLLEVQEVCASMAEERESHVPEDSTRTVQFLHQTAKEYLNNSKILERILQVEAKSASEVQDGNMMFLQFCRQWIDPSNSSARRILQYKAEEEVLLYAPLVEEAILKSSIDLRSQKMSDKTKFLYNLDLMLSRGNAGECWPESHCVEFPPETNTWKSNFLAFAVIRDMRNYVAERLNEDPLLVNSKSGRPLLHYAVFPKCSPRLVEVLLAHHADIKAGFRETLYKRTALQSIDFHFSNYNNRGEPLLETVKLLIEGGADAKSKIYRDGPAKEWVPLIYEIGHMRIPANVKIEMFGRLQRAGAKLNSAGGSSPYTLLESLSRDSVFADRRVTLWLLNNGAKITKKMHKNREEFRYFPWTSKEHTRSKYFVAQGMWR